MSQIARVASFIGLLAVGSCSCTPAGSTNAIPQGSAPAANEAGSVRQVGPAQAPPDFELRALDGSSVRLSDYLGKQVVLIDFWATYCEPCLRAMPTLDALYRKHRARGFVVLGVAIDPADSISEVRADVQKLGVSFPVLLDQDTRVVAAYNPKTSAPFSVLIGRDGRILRKKEGYSSDSGANLERDIRGALDQQVASGP
ncbi:MAG TPA: TlpA disulfide reductase family protein [Polyangiaceae bacterium]|nr:TlpA disulfide reductase family protein [Polyangiaceae bacterium]